MLRTDQSTGDFIKLTPEQILELEQQRATRFELDTVVVQPDQIDLVQQTNLVFSNFFLNPALSAFLEEYTLRLEINLLLLFLFLINLRKK